MNAKILADTSNMTRAEWLKYRTMGIGGSDVSAIAGINPYRSVFQLWLEKTGQVEPTESGSECAHFGTILEPIVKQEFTERTGIEITEPKYLYQHKDYPFMLANLDGVVTVDGEDCIFEAKTASAYKQDEWDGHIPPEYMLQIQHYMAVTGLKRTYIAALIGGNHFVYHIIERDDETFGCMGWKRTHQLIDGNLYCTVEVWDNEKEQWIAKQDVGTTSYTEKEKGQASDSFKRACVSVGIGRELYSAPFVWVSAQKCNIQKRGEKLVCYDKFEVSNIVYGDEREIVGLTIINSDTGEVVYNGYKKSVKKTA